MGHVMRNFSAIYFQNYDVGDHFQVPASFDLSFESPRDVVEDNVLTIDEKRSVLAAWASDAHAVEGTHSLRRRPGSCQIVHIDEILEALRALDEGAGEGGSSWIKRQVRRASIEAFKDRFTARLVPADI